MKYLLFTLFFVFFMSCKESNKATTLNTQESSAELAMQHPGKELMETNCYSCHNPNTKQGGRIAPPMIAVKEHYKKDSTTKEEFIQDIIAWTKKPSVEISKMPGAVRRFGVMPYLPYPEKDIAAIADYMFTHDIDEPEWFEDHRKQEHKREDSPQQSVEEIGLSYAIATKQILGKNLMGAIQKKGTLGALEFCNIQAYPLTDSMATVHNAKIKRVSDKPRNLSNKANAQELEYIESFKTAVANNSDIKPIIKEEGSTVNFYYPITTNAMCLQCHGSEKEVSPETYKALKNLYPADKALGYAENEVRGIWSIQFNSED
ncbi:MAG: DUF3365 domain-containing protein [Cellulophaga sp.]|nr:DUF3365 domain-containing protein [Cellulophaga sp.]